MIQKKSILYREFSKDDIHLTIATCDDKLCLCDWNQSVKFDSGIRKLTRILKGQMIPEDKNNKNEILEKTQTQLTEYLNGQRKHFDIPIMIIGSEFHKKTMNQLLKIKYGEVTTYKQLADILIEGNKMSQCIGSCIGSNLLSIIIPCHRVVSKQFINGGYRGGLIAKQTLLQLEANNS